MKHFVLLLLFQRLYDDIDVLQQLEVTSCAAFAKFFPGARGLVEKPIRHRHQRHIKSVFTWSPLVRHGVNCLLLTCISCDASTYYFVGYNY